MAGPKVSTTAVGSSGSITVSPSNSPYAIQGPSASYTAVTIQLGGYIYLEQQISLQIGQMQVIGQ